MAEEVRRLTLEASTTDQETLAVLAALAEEQGYLCVTETVLRLTVDAPGSQRSSLRDLATLATMSGLQPPKTRAIARGLPEESQGSEIPKGPGVINKDDMASFARDNVKHNTLFRQYMATRAWTALCLLAKHRRYGETLVFSGPMVQPSPSNIPGWKVPRDLDLNSLIKFMKQAEQDIADGSAVVHGLSGHYRNPVVSRTLEFLRAYVQHVEVQLLEQSAPLE